MGEDGWREQTDDWVDAIRLLASLGVEVICYNFMPQVFDDAMVVRTSFETKTRGGAITSSYRAIDVNHQTLVEADVLPISKDEMRANLKCFLDEVIPVAEDVGIKLAMHPDDPPTSPMGGLQRIMSSVEDFEWLLAANPSKANGITYCIGCFAELGCNLEGLIDRWSNRIHFVHFRNISGCQDDFVETFPDDGDVDLLSVLQLNRLATPDVFAPITHRSCRASMSRSKATDFRATSSPPVIFGACLLPLQLNRMRSLATSFFLRYAP